MNHRNFILLFCATALAMGLSACNDDESIFGPNMMGAEDNDIILSSIGGTYELEIYTNGAYHVEFLEDADWLTLSLGAVSNNVAVIEMKYDTNEGFNRMTKFALLSDIDETRCDTVVVRQRGGIDPILRFSDKSLITVAGAGGEVECPIVTNIPYEDLAIEIEYVNEDGATWLTNFEIVEGNSENRTLIVSFDSNADVSPRSATVRFSYTSAWGSGVLSGEITLLQCNKYEEAFEHITFETLRNTYATGERIDEYVGVSGIVVSNKEQGNAGQPLHTTALHTTDYSPIGKTIYFEDEDGKYGIVIYADAEDDNVFDQFDRVTLMLQGATVTKKFEDRTNCPTIYELTNFSPSSMLYSRESGTDAPVKERTIDTLTDDDMFTYVKLKEVEFPIRMGCIFNCDGGFYSAGSDAGSVAITKYPTLVRGKDGGSLYLLTNDHCLYNRDGTRVPYGSGSISGVIVHEHFSRFEWEAGYTDIISDYDACETSETLGNIGKYQIRHQTRGDVYDEMNTSFDDGFSNLICEYRWRVCEKTIGDLAQLGDSLDVPSYGTNGWLTHTYQTYFTGSESLNYTYTTTGTGTSCHDTHFCGSGGTYVYIGPIGNSENRFYGNNRGNKNGIGVVIDEKIERIDYLPRRFAYNRDGEMELACEYAEDYYCGYGAEKGWDESWCNVSPYTYLPNNYNGNPGKGVCRTEMQICYASQKFWTNNSPYGFLLYFSTTDFVSSDNVSLQFTIRGDVADGGTPRYWIVECALPDAELVSNLDSLDWESVGEFTVQDKINSAASNKAWQMMGFKGLNFDLPTSILGKSHVYVRIRPTSDIKGSSSDYESGTVSGDNRVILQYLGVRCNK